MAETPADTIQSAAALHRAAAEIRDDCNVVTRGVRPFLRAVAEFLESSGAELADVNGRVDSCDEPGAVQAALKIARAYLCEPVEPDSPPGATP